MGQTPTETVSEIEQTRRRLDSEIAELETYLRPTSAWMKRAAAILGAVIATIGVLVFVFRKWRQGRSARRLRAIDRRLRTIEDRLDRSAISPLGTGLAS